MTQIINGKTYRAWREDEVPATGQYRRKRFDKGLRYFSRLPSRTGHGFKKAALADHVLFRHGIDRLDELLLEYEYRHTDLFTDDWVPCGVEVSDE